MAPTLYVTPTSPSARAVLITAKSIGLQLTLKEINGFAGEQLKPEYLKLNPQHTIPTLVDDDGFVIWDSHAIMAYLVSKYSKNDNLYPTDLKKRAVVQQRLHFETGVVFETLKQATVGILAKFQTFSFFYFETLKQAARPVVVEGKSTIDENILDKIREIFDILEMFLKDKEWVAGDSVTIADYSLISSVSSINTFFHLDTQKYPKVVNWIKKCEALPEYGVNLEGLKKLADLINDKLKI